MRGYRSLLNLVSPEHFHSGPLPHSLPIVPREDPASPVEVPLGNTLLGNSLGDGDQVAFDEQGRD